MPDQRAQALLTSRSSLRASQETESQEQPHGSSTGSQRGLAQSWVTGASLNSCAHPVVSALKTTDPGVGSTFTGESITCQHSVHGQQAWKEPIHPCLDPGEAGQAFRADAPM